MLMGNGTKERGNVTSVHLTNRKRKELKRMMESPTVEHRDIFLWHYLSFGAEDLSEMGKTGTIRASLFGQTTYNAQRLTPSPL